MADKAKWTFMVYLAGDNNLSAAGDTDLAEMRTVGSTGDVNIVAEFDNAGDRGANRYLIQRDGSNEKVVSLGEIDSGDPKALIDFVEWTARNHPAERYALVLWNHGGGWAPSEMDRVARSVSSKNYSLREAAERSSSPLRKAFFRTTLETIFKAPSSIRRAICSDDGSGHSLDTVELGRVLEKTCEALGKKVDLLGMDACLMSNLEVAYQARPYADYIVASEESEPNQGWPYNTVLGRLTGSPDLTAPELATHIVDAYIKYYADSDYSEPVTQAALNPSRIDTVAGPLDALAEGLIGKMSAMAGNIWSAQKKSARFYHNTLWDVSHFCEELEKATADADVLHAARKVRESLERKADGFVVAESHRGAEVERCRGVSVYLPAMTDVSAYYADLEYAKDHRWAAMLQAYHRA